MTDIVTLIEHASSLVKSTKKTSNFGIYSKTPSHLHYDVRRISNRYELTGDISFRDIEYLQTIYDSSHQFLMDNVYILGEWTQWQSKKYRNYNLKRGTTPSKVSGFVNYR